MTRVELFDYELPEALIAQYPSAQRDGSRLLVVDRATGALADRQFLDLPEYLRAGDVLVLNDSRVIPARLIGEKQGTGARIELFLLKSLADSGAGTETWEVLARPARRLKPGDIVRIISDLSDASGLLAQICEKHPDGSLTVEFSSLDAPFLEVLARVGSMPLPPYIHRVAEPLDTERYQTVYAHEPGSTAAPTAGLHFTNGLLAELACRGVETAFVTLHVGLGTFRPVQVDELEDHLMHEEFYHIPADTAQTINRAKAEGRRIVCVGTTSVRTLESAAIGAPPFGHHLEPGFGATDIFIYPGGHPFTMTDALITNFHLPKSTLLMLVSAFYSREQVLAAYAHAIRNHYRFFSYGDAMLVL